MRRQQFSQFIAAPPATVYSALLDPQLLVRWRVPTGMRATVHQFEPWADGRFRVSLTYEQPDQSGKTSAHTDTYQGRFRELITDARVVETMEFETDLPEMQGEMCLTTSLEVAEGGTLLRAIHEGLPPGVSDSDNALGWRDSLARLADLVESSAT
jgi:uncharacterized protein YndB with AHSA1/START domain